MTVDRSLCGWRRAIRAVGAKFFFLPPELIPVEPAIAKIETPLRKADERAVEVTRKRIGRRLDHFAPNERANCLENAGYASA